MANAGVNAESGERVLWDVIAEHLDEAAFRLGQLEHAFEHPLWSLADIAAYPEARLLAHLDGLLVAGDAIVERALVPALLEPDPEQPERSTAAAIALLQLGQRAALAPAFASEDAAVRRAAVRACALAGSPELQAWVLRALADAREPAACSALLASAAALGCAPPPLLAWLQSDDAGLVTAAALAARRADARTHLPVMEHLLGHPEPSVREAALVTALSWGSQAAWSACRSWALDPSAHSSLALSLYAALGGRGEHARIAGLLGAGAHGRQALFALGLSGNVAHVPALLQWLRAEDPLLAKLAAQSMSMITGVDLGDDAFARKDAPPEQAADANADADAALPPLGDDDLDADLAPAPEQALPEPDAEAIERFWHDNAGRFAPEQRYLAGEPFGFEVVLRQLEHGPQRRSHPLALALAVRTAGRIWLDARAFTAEQRASLQRARTDAPRSLPSPFAGF